MARPLRIEFPAAIHHVTATGDRREPIFEDDRDREALLNIVGEAMERFDVAALAYCLMGDHYDFVLQTKSGGLSRLMRQVNGVYSQADNRRHGKVGHVFQGRFKSIVVDIEAYLLAVCRYVDLNPVRGGMVRQPDRWRWSSYLAHVRRASGPAWLNLGDLHAQLLGRAPRSKAALQLAADRHALWVNESRRQRRWDGALTQQIYLGDASFVARVQAHCRLVDEAAPDVPRFQRARPRRPLARYLGAGGSRDDAIRAACLHGGYSMTEIGRAIELSVSRISRIVRSGSPQPGRPAPQA